ncbi:cysteine synthase A [Helicobacter monodelphidis]|uniref:cysteine synthase A n=1 Tax=Helicobacter sp. 15-1451 TaxID=2004995 RepID=UPI000DCDF951|nr:cysteine synthase A [Helicobacter sp. 15-1451]RAX59243.1 cysteine synthase A [Helicobacter sp. 15-1451]
MKVANSFQDLIGNTPLVKLNFASKESGASIFGKCEFMNPTSSVKDRIALGMIRDGLESGKINQETILIEPTSGNTGVGLAALCASMGIKLVLTMPSSMSLERRKLLLALGAKLELTSPEKGMKGAVQRAQELAESTPNAFILQQFENPANPKIHRETTALEIWEDLNGQIDIFAAGVGTGGTLMGCGEVFKQKNPQVKIIAIEPFDSPVLSGGNPAPHKIQGIGAGFVPGVVVKSMFSEIVKVRSEDAFATSRRLAKEEGLLVGISSGANVWAAIEIGKKFKNRNIVTVLCDTGERYLSTDLYNIPHS